MSRELPPPPRTIIFREPRVGLPCENDVSSGTNYGVVSDAPPSRFFIANFAGIGNGICTVPLLRRLESTWPGARYYHTDNVLFRTPSLLFRTGLTGFAGTTPTAWRRFASADWGAIRSFLESHAIDVVINLRNEGPIRDSDYVAFQQAFAGTGPRFWQLDHESVARRSPPRLLVDEQAAMLTAHGAHSGALDEHWLRPQSPLNRDRIVVGLFTGASQRIKRWPAPNWADLIHRLRVRGAAVVVFAGSTDEEAALASAAVALSGADDVSLVMGRPLEELIVEFESLKLLVSNDTFAVHLAVAMELPVVGLYFATDAAIWGGSGALFTAVASRYIERCDRFKLDAGNCTAYYDGCPAYCQEEITPDRVFATVVRRLGLPDSHRTVPVPGERIPLPLI